MVGHHCLWQPKEGARKYLVRLLLARDNVEADQRHPDRTPLSYAAEDGHTAVVQLSLDRDDVDAVSKDKNGRTPLLWAARNEHESTLRLLVSRTEMAI
jgi:ankyrin repeat protein